VDRGSPAEQAGLHGPNDMVIVGGAYQLAVGGDLIIAVEGQPVTTRDALQKVMDRKHGGDILNLTIYRRGRTMDVKIKLDEAPAVL
jgi:S1-C subfamily serine protease